MVALGKAKRNDKKFCNIYFVWVTMIIRYLAGWIASPPTLLLMEIFFERLKNGESRQRKVYV